MIGVLASADDAPVAAELFELFKTPWEVYRGGRHYEVVLSGIDLMTRSDDIDTDLLLLYSEKETAFDTEHGIRVQPGPGAADLLFMGRALPVYGRLAAFEPAGASVLTEKRTGAAAAWAGVVRDTRVVRIGYDLFAEIRALLAGGQPAAKASMPALDLHIGLLRHLIVASGIPLAEIPPVPAGYSFAACLTHDVDHASIRKHSLDATMFGFLYRATVGSAVNLGRGRISVKKLLTNWTAAAKLPLVHLGLARDFWSGFDRYVDIEQGRPSTFFVLPAAGDPGRTPQGRAPRIRRSGYGVSDIAGTVRRLVGAGCEIGLHGIDAWLDSSRGRAEARMVSETSATAQLGVRMHWLYMNEDSAAVLEEAGFSYDSTVGYNQTVGYRAGTGQVYRPLGAARLLELPMHVMDTALFYPDHLDLSQEEAWERLGPLMDHAARNGGVLTLNWHDRSIAPERLWGDFYSRALEELTARGAWFSTAAAAVSWFRMRRSAVFEETGLGGARITARVTDQTGNLPALRLRLHRARTRQPLAAPLEEDYTDRAFTGRIDVTLPDDPSYGAPVGETPNALKLS